MSVQTTRGDAVLGVVEEVVLMAGAGLSTYLTTHNAADVLTAVGATTAGKNVLALAASGFRTGRLSKVLKLFLAWLAAMDEADAAKQPAHSL